MNGNFPTTSYGKYYFPLLYLEVVVLLKKNNGKIMHFFLVDVALEYCQFLQKHEFPRPQP